MDTEKANFITRWFQQVPINVGLASRKKLFSFDVVEDAGDFVEIKHFPYFWFEDRMRKMYGTNRLRHLYELIGIRVWGKTTIKIHKFFLPELIYILNHSGSRRPIELMEEVIKNTWLKDLYSPDDPPTHTDMSRIKKDMDVKLFDWQEEFIKTYEVKKLRAHLHGELLSFGCGLGKTITSLALMKAQGIEKVIVIAPKSTLVDVWIDHLEKFYKRKPRYFLVNHDNPHDADFFIFNYESMEKIDEIKKFLKGSRVGIIVDESHNFLKIESQRTQNLITLRQELQCDDVLMMSGTPVKSVGIEIMPLLRVIDGFFDDFAQSVFVKAFGFNTTLGADILNARLNMVMHRRKMEDVFRLPEKQQVEMKLKIANGEKYTIDSVKQLMMKYLGERTKYHRDRWETYEREWSECMTFLSKQKKITGSQQWNRYKDFIAYVRKNGYQRFDEYCVRESNWAKQYEKEVLLPTMPKDLKVKFLDCATAIKYLNMKLQGEVLGYLEHLRGEMTTAIVNGLDLDMILKSALKKVVFFTSYVSTVELMEKRLDEMKVGHVSLYGKTSSNAPALLKKFRDDDKIDALIATMQTLATGVTLTEANVAVFLNEPFRNADREQAENRIWRIGQDTECWIVSVHLDTGDAPNLSDRTNEILNWSKELSDAIVDGKVSTEDLAEVSLEQFKSRIPEVDLCVKHAKRLTKEEIIAQWKPGDIIVTAASRENMSLYGKVSNIFNIGFQGSSFSSCKIIGKEGKEVIGYGVETTHPTDLCVVPKDYMFGEYEIIMLLRHKMINDKIRKSVVDFHYKHLRNGTAYDKWTVFLSGLRHFWNETVCRKEDQTQKNLKGSKLQEDGMYCGSIIARAYHEAKCDITCNSEFGNTYVWPKDLLLSPSLTVVGGWFSTASGVK